MSLPLAFGMRVVTIPNDVPYLHGDPAAVADWRERLVGYGGRRVGLVWAGNSRGFLPGAPAMDRRRSITLAHFAGLATLPDLCLVSLQKGEPASQTLSPPAGMVIHDWTEELHDFADTAALVSALDLVISVDTSVVNLAGALGKPVWVLNRFDACWRWPLDRTDSPWYPAARLFRQDVPGDWDSVMHQVVAALRPEDPPVLLVPEVPHWSL